MKRRAAEQTERKVLLVLVAVRPSACSVSWMKQRKWKNKEPQFDLLRGFSGVFTVKVPRSVESIGDQPATEDLLDQVQWQVEVLAGAFKADTGILPGKGVHLASDRDFPQQHRTQ